MFYYISSLPFLFAFAVGGLDFEFCVFVAGHALRSELPFILIINSGNQVILIIILTRGRIGGRGENLQKRAYTQYQT